MTRLLRGFALALAVGVLMGLTACHNAHPRAINFLYSYGSDETFDPGEARYGLLMQQQIFPGYALVQLTPCGERTESVVTDDDGYAVIGKSFRMTEVKVEQVFQNLTDTTLAPDTVFLLREPCFTYARKSLPDVVCLKEPTVLPLVDGYAYYALIREEQPDADNADPYFTVLAAAPLQSYDTIPEYSAYAPQNAWVEPQYRELAAILKMTADQLQADSREETALP